MEKAAPTELQSTCLANKHGCHRKNSIFITVPVKISQPFIKINIYKNVSTSAKSYHIYK